MTRVAHSSVFSCTMAEWCALPTAPDRSVRGHLSRKTEAGRDYVVRVEFEFAMENRVATDRVVMRAAIHYPVRWAQ